MQFGESWEVPLRVVEAVRSTGSCSIRVALLGGLFPPISHRPHRQPEPRPTAPPGGMVKP